ncbi:MAG: filamentous hemagglutinin N-terminal domain-containing protein, partial [Verrucomicrobiales bacterium]|nr:filamentous hemagglutinin N-terminal domain-containing protein [Verrucomicrobiales bacterium]
MNAFTQMRQSRLRFAALPLLCAGLIAQGNPLGEAVRHGQVQFERLDGSLRILQGTDKAIIDWESFSISAGELTEFVQPNANSAALNRVRGAAASRIDGALRANGNVFLINPNGIVIGTTGTVDVNGFIASTLDISDAEFLAGGDMRFRGPSQAGIVNLGRISATGGDVFLIAATVENSGTIDARNGTVGLAAGNDVLLKAAGDGSGERIFVRGASGGKKKHGVLNQGTINANIAELKAHGGNVYALAVKNEGRIAATGVTKRGGQIFLSANGGKIRNEGVLKATLSNGDGGRIEIDAGPGGTVENAGEIDAGSSTGNGGEILILGSQIVLESGSLVIADGETGGGEILIGGGQRGEDPDLMNAENVTVEDGAQISANASGIGNGGRVIVFAENRLEFNGQVSATGGPDGGDGGFVELSGKKSVSIPNLTNHVDVSASGGGIGGTLLFDPVEIQIQVGSGGDPITNPTSNNVLFDADISAFLGTGNLLIDSAVAGPGSGDILMVNNASISWSSANNFSINAARDFLMGTGAEITSTALTGGAVDITAGRDVILDSGNTISTGAGNISISSGGKTEINGGTITGNNNAAVKIVADTSVVATGGTSINANVGGIELIGNRGGTTQIGNFDGVHLANSIVKATDGNVIARGTGGGAALGNRGIQIEGATVEATGAGTVLLDGKGGSGSVGQQTGVGIFSGGTVRSENGNIDIIGVGGGDGSVTVTETGGIDHFSGTIQTTGSGSITLDGTAGDGPASRGVAIFSNVLVGGAGDLTIIGRDGPGAGSTGFISPFAPTIGGASMTGDLIIQTNSINLTGGNFQSSGNLVIEPLSSFRDINLGLSATDVGLQLTDAELGLLSNGFNSITIGDTVSGSGTVTIGAVSFSDPVTIAVPEAGGEIFVNGLITGLDDASITLDGGAPSGGGGPSTTYLNAGISTHGNPISIDDDVVLQNNVLLSTILGGNLTGADVKITGEITGETSARNLSINTGTGGQIDLPGDIGGGDLVGAIDFDAFEILLGGTIRSTDSVSADAIRNISLGPLGSLVAENDIIFQANQGLESESGDFDGIDLQGSLTSTNGSINLSGVSGDTST